VNLFRSGGYEEFKALDDVSFEVKKGEFFGIIGRNGSGKSTLLKILAGIYQPDKGKIHINGLISPFLELGIGFNPELSGRDNVYLNATVLGLSKKQIDEKFDSIIAFSELERFIDQKLKNYSSGMQVRLAFSVSIHANRDILLMDEVLAVGDNNFQSKCLEEFNKYRDMGRTVIIVTHDISVVERYCDRAILLRNGKIEKIGKANDVGNEYIYQNISDEEKRTAGFSREQEDKISSSGSRKIAEIKDVKFLDENGEEKNVFETGDLVNIGVNFDIHENINGFNVGIGLYGIERDERIFSYNTEMDKIKIDKKSKRINLRINCLPLLKGSYYLNVACFGDTEQTYYDIKHKFRKINVFSTGIKKNYKGLCFIDHEWEDKF